MKHTTMLLATLLATVAGFSLPATAQDSETKSHTYSYDANNDGIIQPEEFTTYIYTRSDTNRDGFLGDEEWKETTSQLYRPYKDSNLNTYTYWDQDKDGRLDSNEVKTLIEKTSLYSKWDVNRDGKVDSAEFSKGTFSAYDADNNGMLDLKEWNTVLR